MQNQAKKPTGKGWRLGIAAAVVVLLILGGAAFFWPEVARKLKGGNPEVESDDAKTRNYVTALGRVEPQGGVLTIGIPLADRLSSISKAAIDGTPVKAGDVLARLAGFEERKLEVALLDSKIEEARFQRHQLDIAGTAQIEADKARLEQSKVKDENELKAQKTKMDLLQLQQNFAQLNWDRMAKASNLSIAESDKEKQLLALQQAKADLEAATATYEQMKKALPVNLEAGKKQLASLEAKLKSDLAQVPLKSLEEQRKLAKLHLDETEIKSPIDGRVLEVLAREGELIGQSRPLFRMANTKDLVVIAEVYETDINNIKIGSEAKVFSRTFAPKDGQEDFVAGEVIRIGSLVARNRVVSADPTSDVDRRIIEVVVKLKDGQRLANLIGHQVTVEIARK